MVLNNTQTSPFKLIVLFIFFIFAAIGVVMFALYQAGAGEKRLSNVTMWGTIPKERFDAFLSDLAEIDSKVEKINYIYKNEDTFYDELTNALASGKGPDLLFITNEQIMQNRDRVYATPYKQFDIRKFKDTYIESAESLLLPEGIIGFPVAVDPLVLYWNRTLLANNQYTLPPKQWGELFRMSQNITRRDDSGIIKLSTIALGEFSNIHNAKDILIAMLMQAGGDVTKLNKDNKQIATLSAKNTDGASPTLNALRFFTEFSNPAKSTYTWSRAQSEARDAFVSGDLAMYLGFASELPLILKQNPNLNFDVSILPQLSGGVGQRLSTIARVYAVTIPKVSKHPQDAGVFITSLISKDASILLEKNIGLPSPRRQLLAKEPTDPLKTTFRNSAIMAKSWRDPDPRKTYDILSKMVETVTTGKKRMSSAIERANRELQVLLGNTY